MVAGLSASGPQRTPALALVPPPPPPPPEQRDQRAFPAVPPPPSADGIAVGYPALQVRREPPPAAVQPHTAKTPPGCSLPMLPVRPGRISATLVYGEGKPRSPAPRQVASSQRSSLHHQASSATRHAHLLRLLDLRQKLSPGRDATPSSSVGAAYSDGYSGATDLSGLDALAGACAAMEESSGML
jgi:hypothetical protein